MLNKLFGESSIMADRAQYPKPPLELPEIFNKEFENKKWREPGVDQSDFFNYGFNEETWAIYAKNLREKFDQYKKIYENDKTGITKTMEHPFLNFNLPMEMGGVGKLLMKDKYSRLNFVKYNGEIPTLSKDNLKGGECFLKLNPTASLQILGNIPFYPNTPFPPHQVMPYINTSKINHENPNQNYKLDSSDISAKSERSDKSNSDNDNKSYSSGDHRDKEYSNFTKHRKHYKEKKHNRKSKHRSKSRSREKFKNDRKKKSRSREKYRKIEPPKTRK